MSGAVSGGGRRNGKTSSALLAAPARCVYVCIGASVRYTEALARSLGRHDIRVVGPSWLRAHHYLGADRDSVVVDHALECPELTELYEWKRS